MLLFMNFDPSDAWNLIYERRQDKATIFVSSKMHGGALRAERDAVIAAVQELPLTDPWAWETSADAGPYCSESECIRQAGNSDGLVLIVDDEVTPITRKEAAAARRGGAPVFLMLKTGAERDAELDRFIRELRRYATTANFSSPKELRTRVTSALRTFFLRSWRSRIPATRERARPSIGADFGGIEVMTEDGSWATVSDLVASARKRIDAEEYTEVLESLWDLASSAQEIGLGWLSLQLLDVIDEIVPGQEIDDRWRGWLCNQRGLALSQAGEGGAARREFERMRQLGKALDDADLESTALQNLGVQDVLDSDNDAARSKILRSFQLKHELGDWRGAMQLMSNLVNVLVDEGKLDRADELLDILGSALRAVRDPDLRSSLHGQRGTVAIARGDLVTGQAEFRLALRAARRSGSVPRAITSMQNLGTVAHDLGEPARGSRWYAKALELAESIDDLNQRRIQRQSLAVMLVSLEEYDQAAELFLGAADEAKKLGDLTNAAIALADAGASLMETGDARRGRQLTERALAMPGGSDHWRTHQLRNLARELGMLGEPEAAVDKLLEAANLTEAADRPDALRSAGETAIREPATAERAVEIFRQELDLRRRCEPSERWAWRAAELGATLIHTSETASAVEFFGIALRVFARRPDRREAFFTRNDRALAHAELHDLSAAVGDLRACLQLAKNMRDDALTQQAHMNLGELLRRKRDHSNASDHLKRSLAVARRLEDAVSMSQTLTLLALNAVDQGEKAAALEKLREAENIARRLRDSELQAGATKVRAHLEYDAGRFAGAATLYRRTIRLLGDDNTLQMAESLGGVVLSAAHRGALDEAALDRIVGVSERIGWDDQLLSYLTSSLAILGDDGPDTEVARLAATALAVALRLVPPRDSKGPDCDTRDPDWFRPAVDTSLATTWWIDRDRNRRALVSSALIDICGEDIAGLIMANIDRALDVVAAKSRVA
jgi:tetratricopeptide (TPR) repeat protein